MGDLNQGMAMSGPYGDQKKKGRSGEFRKGDGVSQMPRAGQHGPNHQLEFGGRRFSQWEKH